MAVASKNVNERLGQYLCLEERGIGNEGIR